MLLRACYRWSSLAILFAAMLAACSTPPMRTSANHVLQPPPAVSGTIPSPVQTPTIVPRPKAVQKPETYSVVVNNVRVQELLFALARDAKLNIDIQAGINGTVTMNAIDQTLPQLLTRIARQSDIRWELNGSNLTVMPDSPFLRTYRVDYLNLERLSTSTLSVSGNITAASSSSSGGGGSGGNSSTSNVSNRVDNQFWKVLVENIKSLLQETDKILPAPAASSPGGAPASGALPAQSASGQQPPSTATAQANTPPQQNQGATFREAASVIANPESGVLSIRATSRQHEKVQEFIDQIMASATRQVLIEATVLEVTLSNDYQQGIDWSLLRRGFGGTSGLNLTQGSVAALPGSPTGAFFTGGIADPTFSLGNLSATVRLLESFGNVRVLSSPKISVLNNQSALLRVVDDIVYFKIEATTTAATATSGPVTTMNTTANTVAVGFVLNVTPQIAESETILLNVRPSLTRVLSFVNDPNPALGATPNRIPQLQRREMESLIKVNNGQIAVMGGLIQDEVRDFEDGIPGVRRSGIGALFGQRTRTNAKTELVVFLRPIIVKDPSIDGDYRAFRSLMPDEDFNSRTNPARNTR
jgi:MSHA biogenesis protein MshL